MMDPNDEIIFEIDNAIKIYKSNRVERFLGTGFVPPSTDQTTGISFKDVTITPSVSVRLYLPKLDYDNRKVPVLVYYHGGAFCLGSVFDSRWHNNIASLVSKANVVAVSVEYRLAPEHPLPAAYEDSYAVLDWVVSHAQGGPESWISGHGDLNRVFILGESAGGNIVHHMAMYGGAKIHGAVLVQPYFLSSSPVESEMDPVKTEKGKSLWKIVCPKTSGLDDPFVNPLVEGAPSLAGLGCERVLVAVAEMDILRDRGRDYYEKLKESGWKGEVKFWEAAGEGHGFHLVKPEAELALVQAQIIADFLNKM